MNNFEEFGKGEYVRVSTRRNTYFLYQDDKYRQKTKKLKPNSTFLVQTNFTPMGMEDHFWVFIYPYGWCLIPKKDWKITKVIHPRYHAHCLEYAKERDKWLNQEPNRLFDEDFKYVPIGPDPLSPYGEFGLD